MKELDGRDMLGGRVKVEHARYALIDFGSGQRRSWVTKTTAPIRGGATNMVIAPHQEEERWSLFPITLN